MHARLQEPQSSQGGEVQGKRACIAPKDPGPGELLKRALWQRQGERAWECPSSQSIKCQMLLSDFCALVQALFQALSGSKGEPSEKDITSTSELVKSIH